MKHPAIRLAFVGTGNWARQHHFAALDYIRRHQADDFDLVLRGVTSLDLATAGAVARQYGFERVYPDMAALMADEQIDAIAVAVPPEAACDVILSLVPRGLPLFSEKPPGISTRQAQALADAVTVPNVLAFNRRFIPLNRKFKEIVDGMQEIFFIEGHFLRYNRRDETFVIGTGIHWINFMEYLFGPIEHVRNERWYDGHTGTWNRIARLTFTGDLPGLLKIFPCSGSQIESVEVHSRVMSAYLDSPFEVNQGYIRTETGANQEYLTIEGSDSWPDAVRRGIVGEYQAFFEMILRGTLSSSTFQNAVNSMQVAEAIEYGVDF